jgi:hypothetical protein
LAALSRCRLLFEINIEAQGQYRMDAQADGPKQQHPKQQQKESEVLDMNRGVRLPEHQDFGRNG